MVDDFDNDKQNKERDDGNNPRGRRNGLQGPGGMSPLKFSRGGLSWLIFLGLALAMIALLSKNYPKPATLTIDQFYTNLDNANISELVVKDDTVLGKLKTPTGQKTGTPKDFEVYFSARMIDSSFIKELTAQCRKTGTSLRVENTDNIFIQVLLPLVPWLVIFGFIWFFVFRQLRNTAGGAGMLGNFGRSRHRMLTKEHTNVTFDDVAGIEEAKDEVKEIIEFLRNPKKFQKLGGRIPRGVLLIGEPGCGKTLLAKAIAGEADVPFFSISGSDFVEMFVGVGASRVRDLFTQAKANSPCIIFLDEIDAVGRRRGMGFNGGGHDEREQTLNAILVEIDGFDSSDQVIVIAATNRADVLDPALTRPGRFDRQVYVPLPDIKGRFEILKVHAKKIKMGPNVDLWRLARGTPMFSGADLAAIINEAAIAATMANKESVEDEDMEEARDKVRWGRSKKSRVIDEREKKVIAYHEAGHALASEFVENADPLHKVSIIPRAQAGGMTMMLPETDRHLYTRKYVLAMLQVSLGGRVAEEIACGDISSGASDDIKRASQLARTMICEWGMSDQIGPIRLASESAGSPWAMELPGGKEYSDQTAQVVDQEVSLVIRNSYENVKKILSEHKEQLDHLAAALLKYETLDADEVKRIIKGEALRKTTVTDLLDNVAQQITDPVTLTGQTKTDEKERPCP
ncbi:MAG: ATP-dependent zinc metalloprotease FtsH [Phycisphaerae bacterium]